MSISGGEKARGWGRLKLTGGEPESIIYERWIRRTTRENHRVIKLRDCRARGKFEDYEITVVKEITGSSEINVEDEITGIAPL